MFEHRGIHHAAAQHLEPLAVGVGVHLRGGLGEREVARKKLHLGLWPQEFLGEIGESAFQVAEGDVVVDR